MSVASVAILGAAAFLTHEQSEILPLCGFVPWARRGGWLGLGSFLNTNSARVNRAGGS